MNKLAIVGGGTMGKAIAKRLLATKSFKAADMQITVRREEHAKALAKELGANAHTDTAAACKWADQVLFAVKPQNLPGLFADLSDQGVDLNTKLLISIATGISSAALSQMAGGTSRVVRAMPNTPCTIGAGMTVLCWGTNVSGADKKRCHEIFTPLGETLELDEQHMDTVTGLSASGPAFAYVIIESLADGGVMRGLPRETAITLATHTLLGAAKMVQELGEHPAKLKDDVTTPAGCTIGALLHLEDGRIRSVLARGVVEAARIATKLSQNKDDDSKDPNSGWGEIF